MMKQLVGVLLGLGILIGLTIFFAKNYTLNKSNKVGDKIDQFNNVAVYYNGAINNVVGRNKTPDGYNLGLKYQCVEFVKRYYYKALRHKMPNSYGHAKSFFNKSIKDGAFNKSRGLYQFKNLSRSKPKVNDLVVYDGWVFNKYGHVAIVCAVTASKIEVIQQNVGINSRASHTLKKVNGQWKIEDRVLGWLRK